MASVFSKVLDRQLHTWIRAASTMNVFIEILKHLFFRTFQSISLNCLTWPDQFLHAFQAFAKHKVFAFYFCIVVYLSLYIFVKCRFFLIKSGRWLNQGVKRKFLAATIFGNFQFDLHLFIHTNFNVRNS